MIREPGVAGKKSQKDDIEDLKHRYMELTFAISDLTSRIKFLNDEFLNYKNSATERINEQWWTDYRMSRIIWNINTNLECLARNSISRDIMDHPDGYNPIIRAKIELFGPESLTYDDKRDIMKSKLKRFVGSIIRYTFDPNADLDVDNMCFTSSKTKEYPGTWMKCTFVYDKLIYDKIQETFIDVKNNDDVVDYIMNGAQSRNANGIMVIPDLSLKITEMVRNGSQFLTTPGFTNN